MDVITLPLLLRWAGALLLTLCLMCLSLYLLQNGQIKLREKTPRRLKRLESLGLSRQTTAHLLQLDDNQTFIAITSQQHTTLHPVEAPKKK